MQVPCREQTGGLAGGGIAADGRLRSTRTQPPASFHSIVPVKQWPRSVHSPLVRSHVRPETYGPRSTTGAVTTVPLYRNCTSVPQGSVRWATPTRPFVSVSPHAVPCP